MPPKIDPYAMLGVAESADDEEIKKAFRQIAKRLHPDINHSPGAAVQLADITTANQILTDPTLRREYDRRASQNNHEEFTFSLRVTPSKRSVVPLSEPQVVYLLAEISADARARQKQQKHETRMNLTLVLDHSNSMAGTRLEKVKVAAHQIIEHLSPEDIISVVSFNDWANVLIPATYVKDKVSLKARISIMVASGGTEIYKGLLAGVEQNRLHLGPKLVNHVVLLTDGNTFGDQTRCLELAQVATKEGIAISAMGLGQEWNDVFLDQLASVTGGTSSYISSANAVVRFLNDHVRHLSNAFAERVHISIAPDPDVSLESAFKLTPHPQPLEITDGYIPVGSLESQRPITLMLQIQLPANMPLGFRSVARIVVIGDILSNEQQAYKSISDTSIEITDNPPDEDPPAAILDALSKLTLHRMHQRAQDALDRGDTQEATRHLKNLATRLLAIGEEDLAHQAISEAQRVALTNHQSDEGSKILKYQTRFLLLGTASGDQS